MSSIIGSVIGAAKKDPNSRDVIEFTSEQAAAIRGTFLRKLPQVDGNLTVARIHTANRHRISVRAVQSCMDEDNVRSVALVPNHDRIVA